MPPTASSLEWLAPGPSFALDAQKQPVAGASASAHSGTDFHAAESDARGRFTLDGLPPGKATIVAFQQDPNGDEPRRRVQWPS